MDRLDLRRRAADHRRRVDTGVVCYVTTLTHNWFGWNLNPADHTTILWITVILIVMQTTLNITGAKVMSHVARIGVYVETIGTFGVAIVLGIHGFNHGFGFLFQTAGAQPASHNALGLDFGGHWLTGAALIAVLASVYIFYGFESAGDIAEETKDPGRSSEVHAPRADLRRDRVVRADRGLLLAMPVTEPVEATVNGGGVPSILSMLPSWLQDCLLLVIIAFFSCGTAVQAAGSASPTPTDVTARFPGPGGSPRSPRGSRRRSTRC